jgi:hypothetical protein
VGPMCACVRLQKGLTERQAAQILTSIMQFLAHMHSKGIAHMDIKVCTVYWYFGWYTACEAESKSLGLDTHACMHAVAPPSLAPMAEQCELCSQLCMACFPSLSMCMFVYMCVYMHVCMCVCVCIVSSPRTSCLTQRVPRVFSRSLISVPVCTYCITKRYNMIHSLHIHTHSPGAARYGALRYPRVQSNEGRHRCVKTCAHMCVRVCVRVS